MAENVDACLFANAAAGEEGVKVGDLERMREDIKEELSRISGGGGGTAKTHRRRRQAMRKKALGKGEMPYYVVTEAPSADGPCLEEEINDHPSKPVIKVRLHF